MSSLFILNDFNDELFEKLSVLIASHYPNDFSKELNSKVNSLIAESGFDTLKFSTEYAYREIKSLVSRALFSRLSNKAKGEFIKEGLSDSKVSILFTSLQMYNEKALSEEEISLNDNEIIYDFELKTEMPLAKTNNHLVNTKDVFNQDFKQQEFILQLDLGIGKVNNLTGNKQTMIYMFEQIEKLQEAIDKLY